jgi:sulfatase maturation enzyme AslB (radical SAM superfamily)
MLPSLGEFSSPDDFLASAVYKDWQEKMKAGVLGEVCQKCVAEPDYSLQAVLPESGWVVYYGDTSKCGFRCVMCRHSDKTHHQLKKHNPVLLEAHQFELGDGGEMPLEWILSHVKEISKLSIIGGDPMLSRRIERLLEEVGKTNPRLALTFNFNGSGLTLPSGRRLSELLEPFSHLELSCSIDGIGDDFSLIRPGPSYGVVKENIHTLRQELPAAKFSVGITVSNQNVKQLLRTLPAFYEEFPAELYDYYLNTVHTPSYLSPWKLSYKDKVQLKKDFRPLLKDDTWGRFFHYLTTCLGYK